MTRVTMGERERKRGIFLCDKLPLQDSLETKRGRGFSLPEVFQPARARCWAAEAPTESLDERQKRNSEPFRRHSWSFGINNCGIVDGKDLNRPSRKLSQDSRHGSSSHSIPEIIEECGSDDEFMDTEVDSDKSEENLRCRNCFQKDKTVLVVKSDKYAYCGKCRDMLRNKNKYGTMIPFLSVSKEIGGKINSFHELLSTSPPRRSRKTSLPDTVDLPRIEEPVTGEEGTDTKELQLIVEKEVHKLLNFGSSQKCAEGNGLFCNQKRRNSDNDLNLITVGLKNMFIHKNADLIQ